MHSYSRMTAPKALSDCVLWALRDLIVMLKQPDLEISDIFDQVIFTAHALKAYRVNIDNDGPKSLTVSALTQGEKSERSMLSPENLLLCSTIVTKTRDENSTQRDEVIISHKLAKWAAASFLCKHN